MSLENYKGKAVWIQPDYENATLDQLVESNRLIMKEIATRLNKNAK